MLISLIVSAQCTQSSFTAASCAKTSTGKDGVCTEACAAKVCTSGKEGTASAWSGKIEINGKRYLATGKIYNTAKETTAKRSIPELKIANEIFVVSRANNNRYSCPKNDLGFIRSARNYQ